MLDTSSILFLIAFSFIIMILYLVDCCCCHKHDQQQLLPRSTIPPATHQPHLVSPMHRWPRQSNGRTGIPISAPRLTSMSSSIPRNYGMVHVPFAVEEPNYNIEQLINEIRRSNQVGNTMVSTYPSRTMDSMPREPPKIPVDGAFKIASNLKIDKSTECAVCLSSLEGEEKVVEMPQCAHLFHENCILRWLPHQESCPLCRTPAIPKKQ